MPTCTVHASGVFSLFSALAFATREHEVRRIVFFDYHGKFWSLAELIGKIAPILEVFSVPSSAVVYVTHEDQAANNIAAIYNVADTRIIFAESLQNKRVQDLLRILGPEQIHFYAEGAMSFGPIRVGLPTDIARELHSVHYVDYSGLRPIALKQYPARDAGMSAENFKALFLRLFDLLDSDYRDMTEIDHFMQACPTGGIVLLHQNLSEIAGFDPKAEREIFTGIQKQLLWFGSPVVFMHPKSARNVPDIFDVNLRSRNGDACIFVAPPFPMAEYYVHKLSPKLCVGVFSSGLLNLKVLGIPTITVSTNEVGRKIKTAFDSNIYALHLVQLSTGSDEHASCLYPSLDFERLAERLNENDFLRCADQTARLWELPYYLGDEKELSVNLAKTHADWSSLDHFRHLPAFRRLSPYRKEMLMNVTMTPAQVRKRKLYRLAKQAYSKAKKFSSSLLPAGKKP